MEDKPDKETLEAWHNDPDNWKLGIFYYNKQDKRIFAGKRLGLGWTLNFANPFSIIFILVLLAPILAILLL